MVKYDQSTAARREQEVRRQRKEQLEALGELPALGGELSGLLRESEEEATAKHIKNLKKLRDWEAGTDPERAAATQLEIDEVRRQWLSKKHGGRTVNQAETQGPFIDERDWDKAMSGGWSIPPVLPSGMTPGVLSAIEPNNQKGGFEAGQIIVVFETDEENGSFRAPLYIGLDKALWVLKRLSENLGFTLGEVMRGEVADVPCLIDWEENTYDGKVRVAGAVSPHTEGL